MSKRIPASRRLIDAIENSAESRYRISKNTGVAEAVLCRLVRGDGWIGREAFDRLTAYLDLDIVTRKGK